MAAYAAILASKLERTSSCFERGDVSGGACWNGQQDRMKNGQMLPRWRSQILSRTAFPRPVERRALLLCGDGDGGGRRIQ
jgi:hypothetical protein